MQHFIRKIAMRVVVAGALVSASAALFAVCADEGAHKGNTLIMTLKSGEVTIRLRPDLAPRHVERIKTLTREGFYDGLAFHRVIAGFMAQTGDPTGTGSGGSSLPNLAAEFTSTPFVRGTLGMARTQNPNSANSQFFIMFANGDWLNGQYTVFGEVINGMDHVDRIKKGDRDRGGQVNAPDRILSMRLVQ